MYGMTFNGIRKEYVVTLRGKRRPSWAPLTRNTIQIPGYAGARVDSTSVEMRKLDIPILIESKSLTDLKKLTEDFASWLVTKEAKELIFDDEPDRIYYAMVDGTFDPEEIVSVGAGTLTFICPDPYKYGVEKSTIFTDSGIALTNGSAETHPITQVTVNADTTFVAIGNGDKVNIVGEAGDVTQTPYVREEQMLWHEMGNFIGWADTTSVEEGIIAGTMKTTGYSFYTDDFGSGSAWHGPAKKISLPTTLQDFKVDALIRQKGITGQVGSIEIALLDVNNQFVGKMTLTKRSKTNPANWARLRAGSSVNGYDIMNDRGANDWTWADFNGIVRIGRIDNTWFAHVALIDSAGRFNTQLYREWKDNGKIATKPVAQIQVQLWQYSTVPRPTEQWIADVKAYRINNPADNQIPYIARAGDVIEFDHQNDIIRRNGEDVSKDKAFIGDYFSLQPGANAIVVEPADLIEKTEVRWRDKWL